MLPTSENAIFNLNIVMQLQHTVIRGDFGLPGWLRKSSLNCNISKAILFFLLFFSSSAPHHSDVSLGTSFEFMKVFWFEEERRMCDISSVRIKQPFLTYFCIIMIFIFIWSETRRAECSKKLCMPFHLYAVFHL